MKSAIRYFSFYVIIALSAGSFAHGQKVLKNKDLPNFSQVNATLYRGGQPTEAGVRELAKIGVKTIINLRGEDKNSLKEKEWARNLEIKFIAVDLSNWFKPKTADITEIIKEIDQSENQPVFVHCRRGSDRTGTVVAVYRMTHDNWTAKRANEEAKKFGFGWWQVWMKDYIEDFYKNSQNDKNHPKTPISNEQSVLLKYDLQ